MLPTYSFMERDQGLMCNICAMSDFKVLMTCRVVVANECIDSVSPVNRYCLSIQPDRNSSQFVFFVFSPPSHSSYRMIFITPLCSTDVHRIVGSSR
ncbi:hypothetical protein BT69DRAFT_573992 [Atractiella rhizophila]|nr:hypothetical protein BT69DRAFT_573992 [Atractiella rhizophila]